MDETGAIIGLIVVAIVVVGGAAMAQFAYEDTGDLQSQTESFNASNEGDLVILNESNRQGVFYGDTANVTNESGELMLEGQDYEWFESNGTLQVQSQSLVNDTATVDYNYRIPSQQQTQMASFLAQIFDSAYAIPFIFIVVLVIGAALALGGLS